MLYEPLGGYCGLYAKFCRDARAAREAYRIAAERLGYSWEKEALAVEAAARAYRLGGDTVCRVLYKLYETIPGRTTCIIGPLARGIPRACDVVMAPEALPVAGVRYHVIAGDMDSRWDPYTLSASADVLLVHVHGDNFSRAPYSRILSSPGLYTAFTSQAYCWWPVLGIGGFTDGDRLVGLSFALGARDVILVGFDFERPVCTHKTFCIVESKRAKLEVSWEVIGRMASEYGYYVEALEGGIRFLRTPGR